MDKRKKPINNLSAIFLLAGYGKRISNLTSKPKCLLKINNQTIISRNLKILKELKIKNIILVLGFKKELIKKEIINYKKYFKFNYVYNENYKKFGNSYSLLIGLKKTKGKAIIFDGDLIYSKKILENFLLKGHHSSFLIGKNTIDDIECAKALADNNGFVRKTVDKRAVNKFELKKFKFIGEAIGILRISNKIRKLMTNELKKFFKIKKNLILNWEHFMNEFLKDNIIMYNKTSSSKWIEIDTKKDYLKATSLFKNK